MDTLEESRANLKRFWAAEAPGFRDMWRGLDENERGLLIRSSSPHMAVSAAETACVCGCGLDMSGSTMLIPELILSNLVKEDGDGSLPAVLHSQANTDQKDDEANVLLHQLIIAPIMASYNEMQTMRCT
jgi:hypothetical protein